MIDEILLKAAMENKIFKAIY